MSSQPIDTSTSGSPQEFTLCDPPPLGPPRSDLDRFMRRLLRLPIDGPKATAADAQKAFQTSIMVASVRCLLMYVVFPFVLPAVGLASGVGPWIGLPISFAAIIAITISIRRFWRADHSKRWHYTVLGTMVIGFLVFLVINDIADLLS